VQERAHRREAIFRIQPQPAEDHLPQPVGDSALFGRRLNLGATGNRTNTLAEGEHPVERLVKRGAETELVSALVRGATGELLRRHVARRPNQETGPSDPRVQRIVVLALWQVIDRLQRTDDRGEHFVAVLRTVGHARQAKVENSGAAVPTDQYVFGLEV